MKAFVFFLSLCVWNVSTTSSLLASDFLREYVKDPTMDDLELLVRQKLVNFAIANDIRTRREILALFLAMSEYIAKSWLVLKSHSSLEEGFENDTKFAYLKLVRKHFESEGETDDFYEAYLLAESTNAWKVFGSSQLSENEIAKVKESKRQFAMQALEEKVYSWQVEDRAKIMGSSVFQKAKFWALKKIIEDPEILQNAYQDNLNKLIEERPTVFPFENWESWSDFRTDRFDGLPLTVHRHLAPWMTVLNILMVSKIPSFMYFATLWKYDRRHFYKDASGQTSELSIPNELGVHILQFYCRLQAQPQKKSVVPRRQACNIQ